MLRHLRACRRPCRLQTALGGKVQSRRDRRSGSDLRVRCDALGVPVKDVRYENYRHFGGAIYLLALLCVFKNAKAHSGLAFGLRDAVDLHFKERLAMSAALEIAALRLVLNDVNRFPSAAFDDRTFHCGS